MCCGLLVVGVSGWGLCPCLALFERTRNLTGTQAAVAFVVSRVVFRRLHPHQNPGAGDLPGKDRAPNLGPGMCACARPECRVPLALADLVEFHPHTPLCIPDRLRDRRTGDHQGSLTPHQFRGTRRPRQPLITPRTPTDTPPKRNSTAIPAGGAAARCRRRSERIISPPVEPQFRRRRVGELGACG